MRTCAPVADRWAAKVVVSDGCWEWSGTLNSWGYGTLRVGSRRDGTRTKTLAHRLSWELHFGIIPEGLNVCHHCDNPACVRPDHLFVGSDLENRLDCKAKGRVRFPSADRRRAQTHCTSGHEFTEKNTWRRPNGTRKCRECDRLRHLAAYRSLREAT